MPLEDGAVLQSYKWEEMQGLGYLQSGWHSGLTEAPWPQDHSKEYDVITRWGELAEARPEPGLNVQDPWRWKMLSAGTVTRTSALPLDQYMVVAWRVASN